MTLRRGMYVSHGIVAALLVAAGAWLARSMVSYTPDPLDPWPAGPGLVELTLAAANVGAALLVALGVRDWARTGRRSIVAIGDVVVGVTIVLTVVFVPPVLTVGAIGALGIAGWCVAAARNASR